VVDYIQEFGDSFARISDPQLAPRFFDAFYDRFIASDPAVAAKFDGTDFEHQKRVLRESLAEMRDFFLAPKSNPYIVTLARIHGSRGRDIPPAMFDRWLDTLVDTVRAVDPGATDNIALAWRIVMTPGIEFMKFYRDR
jgi:truncated hemoglobin YjbI